MDIGVRPLQNETGHTAGRRLLSQMYREQTGNHMPPIALTDRGKPYFPESHIYFSISHTDQYAFCVLSQKQVGIDAEHTDRRIDLALADKILSPTEKARYLSAPDRRQALLRLWVLKEAYAKATGRGLGSYLYETDFDPNDPRIRVMNDCFVAVIEL